MEMTKEKIKKAVRENYGKIAKNKKSCCTPVKSCCGTASISENISKKIGYSDEDIKNIPEEANLGLGCGNPVALASLKENETVLDLGSGAGMDCFLAATKVGKNGRVIGVDMTPEMVENARENARKNNSENIEFRLGEIENLPVADNSVDVVISNCVINLSPDKARVFKETYRVLKSGGRLMISDMVLTKELPEFLTKSVEAYVGCISGAIKLKDYIGSLEAAGFKHIKILNENTFPVDLLENDPQAKKIIDDFKIQPEMVKDIASSVVSIKVYGLKP